MVEAQTRIGPYSLVQRLGAGGMAEVWLARFEGLGGIGKTVAVKLLGAQLVGGETYQRMFMTEARLAMMLSHSNLVQVFDVGQIEGRLYMAMEWVDGLDLSRLLKQLRSEGTRLSPHVVAHVIEQMLRGLAYAHGLVEGGSRETIVHRDISPHNVLISVSGEVKISDFGIARLASEDTTGLHVRGKLRYMPPEQALGKSRAPTVDLFAVGAVMHEALSGRPFRGDVEPEQLFQAVVQGEMPPLGRDDVPPELLAVLDGLLRPSRHERFASAEQALEALHRWPGLRSASDELAALARRFSGIEAPRSGLSLDSKSRRVSALHVDTQALAFSEAHDGPTSRTGAVSAALVGSSTSQPTLPRAPMRRREAARGLVLAALALAGLGLGVAWALGDHDAQAGVFEAGGSTIHPRDEPGPELELEPEPALSVDLPSESPQVVAPAPQVVADAPTPELPAPRKATRRMKVVLSSGESHYVRARVGKRELDVEGSTTLELVEGRYALAIRDGAGQWRTSGTLVVAAGHDYRVELGPAGAIVRASGE